MSAGEIQKQISDLKAKLKLAEKKDYEKLEEDVKTAEDDAEKYSRLHREASYKAMKLHDNLKEIRRKSNSNCSYSECVTNNCQGCKPPFVPRPCGNCGGILRWEGDHECEGSQGTYATCTRRY